MTILPRKPDCDAWRQSRYFLQVQLLFTCIDTKIPFTLLSSLPRELTLHPRKTRVQRFTLKSHEHPRAMIIIRMHKKQAQRAAARVEPSNPRSKNLSIPLINIIRRADVHARRERVAWRPVDKDAQLARETETSQEYHLPTSPG